MTLRYITDERFGAAFSAPQFITIICRAVNRSGRACASYYYIHPRANARASAREGGATEPRARSGTLLSKIARGHRPTIAAETKAPEEAKEETPF